MRADDLARRVVVDTNIWISAALTKEGAPALLARRVLALGMPVLSEATLAELDDRIWRPKFDAYLSIEMRQRIVHDLSAAALWVEVSEDVAAQTYCRDPGDDKFIHVALCAQAPWLVTGDKDLLETPRIPGLRIISPAGALRLPEFLPED